LISAGHLDALDYTPRQAAAFLRLARLRRRREAGERLAIAALASRGEPDEINKRLKEWEQ
jgi:hypothetical protein